MLASLTVGAAVQPATAQRTPSTISTGSTDSSARHWVTGWQGSPVRGATFDRKSCPSDAGLNNQTVRNLVPVSTGGDSIRIRLSNAYGDRPLRVGAGSVARSAGPGAATLPGTTHTLRFGGRSTASIPVGGTLVSDPVMLSVKAGQQLAISVYLPTATGAATQHYFATQDNYLAAGDKSRAVSGVAYPTKITCWMFASGVDVRAGRRINGTVVTLGDSITDGFGSTQNANRRYPDYLARRLQARPGETLSVSNAGIGGNTILRPRTDFTMFGATASARLDRDVLTQAGATDVILLEGINDIGKNKESAQSLIEAQRAIIAATQPPDSTSTVRL